MADPLNYVGVEADTATGYTIAARNLVRAVRELGQDVVWTPNHWKHERNVQTAAASPRPCCACVVHTVPEYYPLWRARHRAAFGRHPPIWGHTVWETDRLPAQWPALLNDMDGVIVPTEWNKSVFRASGVTTRIEVLPHVSQFEGKAPTENPVRLPELADLEEKFVFYAIGSWTERKAPWLALNAFLSAFTRDDPVVFVLKTEPDDRTRPPTRHWRNGFRGRHQRSRDALKSILSGTDRAAVIVIDRYLGDAEIAALHGRGDCYVSLSRGEGWGFGIYEAAWWGKPVIVEATGAPLEYLPPEDPYFVDCRMTPVRAAKIETSYTTDQRWAEPDIAHAARLMRAILSDPPAARARGKRIGDHIREHFSSATIARHFLDIVKS